MKNNKKRDNGNYLKLKKMGWGYYIAWECFIQKDVNKEVDKIISILNR